MGNEEWEAAKEPIFSGWVTQGPKVAEFERLFALRHKVKHAVAVSNCTTALHLALLALDIGPGDEVLVPAFTWVSTANAVLYCGARPIFVDIDRRSFNINPKEIEKKISSRTKAIIPVHLFGLCANMDEINRIVPHLKMIEDGACAAGAGIKDRPAGSFGNIGCFSFHPRKSITTGEGGMLTTDEPELAERMTKLRNHGASVSEEQRHKGARPYILPEFNILGYNYRMTDIQGAIGIVQLKKMDNFIHERQKWAEYYTNELSSIPWLETPVIPVGYKHGWQSYVLNVDEGKSPLKRNEIMDVLHKHGISTRPGTHAVHMLGYYANKFQIKPEEYPGAFAANEYSMAIPLHNKMVKEDFEYIVKTLKRVDERSA